MKFSIVTITYNRAHLIGDTIKSVLEQTHTDFEHIIIDDGSIDNTEEVANSFNDARIRYHKYPKSGHRSFLRNEGFRKSTGQLIGVLDSDDLWVPDKLEIVLKVFRENPTVEFVLHNVDFLPAGAISWKAFPYYTADRSGNLFLDVLSEKILPFPLFTIKKSALEKIGMIDETMIDGQHDFYLRASAELHAYYSHKVLMYMRKHDQNLSLNYLMSHYDDYFRALENLLIKGVLSESQLMRQKSKIHNKMAYIYYTRKQYKMAKSSYLESFRQSTGYFGIKSGLMYLWLSLWQTKHPNDREGN